MSCRSKVVVSLLCVFTLCSLFTVGALGASTYSIKWNSENTFLVYPSTYGTWYVVECDSTGTWDIIWERSMTLANTPVSITALKGITCNYRVRVYDTEGGDLEVTSNVLTYNPKTFLLTLENSYTAYWLMWDSVENVTKYTIQFATDTNYNWVDYRLATIDPTRVDFYLTDEGFKDKYVRIVAWNGNHVLSYSNSVYVTDISSDVTIIRPSDDPSITRIPLPLDTVPPIEYNKNEVKSFWQIAFQFLNYTSFGAVCVTLLGVVCSFMVVAYVVFKAH